MAVCLTQPCCFVGSFRLTKTFQFFLPPTQAWTDYPCPSSSRKLLQGSRKHLKGTASYTRNSTVSWYLLVPQNVRRSDHTLQEIKYRRRLPGLRDGSGSRAKVWTDFSSKPTQSSWCWGSLQGTDVKPWWAKSRADHRDFAARKWSVEGTGEKDICCKRQQIQRSMSKLRKKMSSDKGLRVVASCVVLLVLWDSCWLKSSLWPPLRASGQPEWLTISIHTIPL